MKTELYNQNALNALEMAKQASDALGHGFVGSEHILLGLARAEGAARTALVSAGITYDRLLELADTPVSDIGRKQFTDSEGFAADTLRILELALYEAKSAQAQAISTAHILLSVLREKDCFGARIMEVLGADVPSLKKTLAHANDDETPENSPQTAPTETETQPGPDTHGSDAPDGGAGPRQDAFLPLLMKRRGRQSHTAEASKEEASDAAEAYCTDLTALARSGALDPLIGCETELNRLIQTLIRRTKNNPVLVGKPGVGKSAIVEGFAQLLAEGRVPSELAGARLLSLDLGAIVAGSKYRGEFEDRFKKVLASLEDGTMLFIDELHTIVGAGAAEGSVDAANILKPALARGRLRMIGATTFDEYRKYIEKDAALERRFSPIAVDEPTGEETLGILRGLRSRYEAHHGVTIGDDALAACVELSVRCMPDRCLPDKAIDLLDEAAANLRIVSKRSQDGADTAREAAEQAARYEKMILGAIENGDFELAAQLRDRKKEALSAEKQGELMKKTLTAAHVARVAHEFSGMPEGLTESEMNARAGELETTLARCVFGQNNAIEQIASAIRGGFAGLSDPSRPIASIIIAGGTGTGKTLLAGRVAQALYGRETELIRFPADELNDENTINLLLGAPPGFKDSEEGGRLSEKVRRKPYSVVLFDNCEGLCREAESLIMKIFKDGFLLDSRGRTVSFRNAVVIVNVSTGEGARQAGFGSAAPNELAALKKLLSPELIAAADCVCALERLSPQAAVSIAQATLNGISERALRQAIRISFDEGAASDIVRSADSTEIALNGAYAVLRAVSRTAEKAVSLGILKKELVGGQSYACTVKAGEARFEKLRSAGS